MTPTTPGPRGRAVLASVAISGLVVTLAACSGGDTDAGEAAAASASAEASAELSTPPDQPDAGATQGDAKAAGSAEGPYDDEAIYELLASFEPPVDAMTHMHPSGAPAVDTAAAWGGATVVEIEPAACKPFYALFEMSTDLDGSDAARDAVDPGGRYVPEDGDPDAPEAPHITLFTRVFADPALAAALAQDALDADCDQYVATFPEYGVGRARTIQSVDESSLDGVGGDVLHVAVETSNTGEGAPDETWTSEFYYYADGANAIQVGATNVDDPDAVAAQLIADYVEHMSGS